MFTGIVEDTGAVLALARTDGGARLALRTALDLEATKAGDSIAVDGVCLTVVDKAAVDGGGAEVSFDLGSETLAVTTLGALAAGARVHLERALRFGDRLDGHLVTGHVDAVGRVTRREHAGASLLLRFSAPAAVLGATVQKGSIAVDGTSLTVNAVDDDGFEVCLIPHTLERTKLGALGVGDPVNLESDLLGKYVARLLEPRRRTPLPP